MTFESKKRAHLIGGIASLFAASAALLVLVLPGGREAIDYLIAGTFATAISLSVAFGLFVKGRDSFFDAETLRHRDYVAKKNLNS